MKQPVWRLSGSGHEDGLTVLFPGGITVGTKEADVLAAYGEPTDSYKDEEYGNTYSRTPRPPPSTVRAPPTA